jgi:hypothetical protein
MRRLVCAAVLLGAGLARADSFETTTHFRSDAAVDSPRVALSLDVEAGFDPAINADPFRNSGFVAPRLALELVPVLNLKVGFWGAYAFGGGTECIDTRDGSGGCFSESNQAGGVRLQTGLVRGERFQLGLEGGVTVQRIPAPRLLGAAAADGGVRGSVRILDVLMLSLHASAGVWKRIDDTDSTELIESLTCGVELAVGEVRPYAEVVAWGAQPARDFSRRVTSGALRLGVALALDPF